MLYHCYYINIINTARQSLAIGSSGFDHTLLYILIQTVTGLQRIRCDALSLGQLQIIIQSFVPIGHGFRCEQVGVSTMGCSLFEAFHWSIKLIRVRPNWSLRRSCWSVPWQQRACSSGKARPTFQWIQRPLDCVVPPSRDVFIQDETALEAGRGTTSTCKDSQKCIKKNSIQVQ